MKVPRSLPLVAAVAALSALLVAPAGTSEAHPAPAGTDRPLRALADRAGLRIGTAVDMTALAEDATYRKLVARQFSSVTAENVMKWSLLEPVRGDYVWEPADELVGFARRNGQKVRGHVLVWHSQLPEWVNEEDFTADELRSLLRAHITAVARHFRGRVHQWDVVNEAFNEDGTLRDTIWLRALGPDYIADAFRWAHRADPRALLFYNDYNISWSGPKSDAVYALVEELQSEGVPIHGVGFQGHLGIQYGLPGGVAENYQRFSDLGVQVAVTEADVRMIMPPDEDKLATQAEGYRILLDACLRATTCRSFTVWGFTDRYSWVPSVFEGEGAANLLDEDYRPKPAYTVVQQTLAAAGRRR